MSILFDRPLHKHKDWYLLRTKDVQRHSDYPGNSMIVHRCPLETSRSYGDDNICWFTVTNETKCDYCGTKPSEDLNGLWHLHNFDWIQNGAIYQ